MVPAVNYTQLLTSPSAINNIEKPYYHCRIPSTIRAASYKSSRPIIQLHKSPIYHFEARKDIPLYYGVLLRLTIRPLPPRKDIFLGGTDTGASVVDWAMANMMRNPEVMRKAQEEVRQVVDHKENVKESDLHELHYLKMVIKETLRLHPPAPLLVHRECMKEATIEGYIITAKARILINAWAIGRDPNYWDDPEAFRPERFEGSPISYLGNHFQLIPFGAGRRICPGLALGMVGIELAMANLLYSFNWDLPAGMISENVSLEERFGLASHRKEPLLVVPTVA